MKPSIADFILAAIQSEDPELYQDIKTSMETRIEDLKKEIKNSKSNDVWSQKFLSKYLFVFVVIF